MTIQQARRLAGGCHGADALSTGEAGLRRGRAGGRRGGLAQALRARRRIGRRDVRHLGQRRAWSSPRPRPANWAHRRPTRRALDSAARCRSVRGPTARVLAVALPGAPGRPGRWRDGRRASHRTSRCGRPSGPSKAHVECAAPARRDEVSHGVPDWSLRAPSSPRWSQDVRKQRSSWSTTSTFPGQASTTRHPPRRWRRPGERPRPAAAEAPFSTLPTSGGHLAARVPILVAATFSPLSCGSVARRWGAGTAALHRDFAGALVPGRITPRPLPTSRRHGPRPGTARRARNVQQRLDDGSCSFRCEWY